MEILMECLFLQNKSFKRLVLKKSLSGPSRETSSFYGVCMDRHVNDTGATDKD